MLSYDILQADELRRQLGILLDQQLDEFDVKFTQIRKKQEIMTNVDTSKEDAAGKGEGNGDSNEKEGNTFDKEV